MYVEICDTAVPVLRLIFLVYNREYDWMFEYVHGFGHGGAAVFVMGLFKSHRLLEIMIEHLEWGY